MEKLWYVVNTYSGHEAKVKEKLEMRAASMGFEDYIFRVVIPEETVIEKTKSGEEKDVPWLYPC
jgi:transcriptional antiterminator NusG